MKKTKNALFIFFLLISIMLSTVIVNADNAYGWYIKRQGDNRPIFPDNSDELINYSAYFIDELASLNKDKVIYLTFDAGYENGNISKILDILKEEDVPAAFFILDNIILKNTDLVKRMASEGHLVCNHTKNHKNICNYSYEAIEKDLSSLEELCLKVCGVQMKKYFRFPEGKFSYSSLKSVKQLGYKTFFWSFAYDDWDNKRQPDIEKSKKKILSNTHNGAVFLFHPTSDTNAKIMSDLIKEWKQLGYTFGTLDQLVEKNSN